MSPTPPLSEAQSVNSTKNEGVAALAAAKSHGSLDGVIGTCRVRKRRDTRIADVRHARPSNTSEVSALSALLAPSRRAFVKICGQLPPTASLWDSYADQFTLLQVAFDNHWALYFSGVTPPDLPRAPAWKGGILGLHRMRVHAPTILREFEIKAYRQLNETMLRLRDEEQGPFNKEMTREPEPKAVARRVLKANAHCLNERASFFQRRPTLKPAHEAQKWCLRLLRDRLKQKQHGEVRNNATNAMEDALHTGKRVAAVAARIIERYPDRYCDWLREKGTRAWKSEYQNEWTGREFSDWLAPILYTFNENGPLLDQMTTRDLDISNAQDSSACYKCDLNAPVFRWSRAFSSTSRSREGWNTFLGAPGDALDTLARQEGREDCNGPRKQLSRRVNMSVYRFLGRRI